MIPRRQTPADLDSPWKEVRRVTALFDPRATREGLSVRPLGHRTYLKAKARGERSLFGKAGYPGTARRVRQSRPGWYGESCIASTPVSTL